MSCQVLGVACSVSAWLRSVVAEHAEARTVHQENPAPISKDVRGRGGRGGVVATFWKGGGAWSVLKTLALGRVPSTPPPLIPWKSAQQPPLPPSGCFERARSVLFGGRLQASFRCHSHHEVLHCCARLLSTEAGHAGRYGGVTARASCFSRTECFRFSATRQRCSMCSFRPSWGWTQCAYRCTT